MPGLLDHLQGSGGSQTLSRVRGRGPASASLFPLAGPRGRSSGGAPGGRCRRGLPSGEASSLDTRWRLLGVDFWSS